MQQVASSEITVLPENTVITPPDPKNSKTYFWRRIGYVCIYSVGSILLLLCSVIGILNTHLGSQAIVNIINQSQSQLQLGKLTGSFLRQGQLSNIRFQSISLNLHLNEAQWAWDWQNIWQGTFGLSLFRLSDGEIQKTLDQTSPQTQDNSLPELPILSLPVHVFINQLAIERVRIQIPQHSIKVELLSARLDWHNTQLKAKLQSEIQTTHQIDHPKIDQLTSYQQIDLDVMADTVSHALETSMTIEQVVPALAELTASPLLGMPFYWQLSGKTTALQGEIQLNLEQAFLKHPLRLTTRFKKTTQSDHISDTDTITVVEPSIRGQLILTSAKDNLRIDIQKIMSMSQNTWDWYQSGEIKINQVAEYWPLAKGQISSQWQGYLSPDIWRSKLQAMLSINEFSWQKIRVPKLDFTVSLDESISELSLKTSQVEFSGQTIHSLSANLTGTPQQHHFSAVWQSDLLNGTVALNGQFDKLNRHWQGQWQDLRLQSLGMDWRSTHQANVDFSSKHVRQDTLCVREVSVAGQVCLQSHYQFKADDKEKVGLKTHLAISNVQINDILKRFLPVVQLTSVIDGFIKLDYAQQLVVSARIGISRGQIHYIHQGRPLNIPVQNANVLIEGDEATINLKAEGNFSDWLQLNAQLTLAEPLQTMLLKGSAHIVIPAIANFAPLVDQVQRLAGRLQAELTFSGNLKAPQFVVNSTLTEGQALIPSLNILVNQFSNQLQFRYPEQIGKFSGSASLGEGIAHWQGDINLINKHLAATLKGEALQVANTHEWQAWVSPNLSLTLTPKGNTLTGEIEIPRALIAVNPQNQGQPIKRNSPDLQIVQQTDSERQPFAINLDVIARLGEAVNLKFNDFDGRLKGELRLIQTQQPPIRGSGTIEVASGEYQIYGQNLRLKRGRILFSGGNIANPALDIEAARQLIDGNGQNVEVGIRITGTVQRPKLVLFSIPNMPNTHILAYLLLGRAPNANSGAEMVMLLNTLRRLQSGDDSEIDKMINRLGLSFSQAADGSTQLGMGKQLNDRLFVGYGVGLLNGEFFFQLRYKISRWLQLEVQSGGLGTNADVLYSKERE